MHHAHGIQVLKNTDFFMNEKRNYRILPSLNATQPRITKAIIMIDFMFSIFPIEQEKEWVCLYVRKCLRLYSRGNEYILLFISLSMKTQRIEEERKRE
jgi:hypothetical protein